MLAYTSMKIILDTNIIRSDFFLSSNQFQILKDFAIKTFSTLVIPKIVMEELFALYKRELLNQTVNIQRSLIKLNKLLNGLKVIHQNLELDIYEVIKDYEAYIHDKLAQINSEMPEYKDSFLKEVIKRSNERIKPISIKGEEFRDTILWLTILDYLNQEKSEEVVFISNNVMDFADGNQMFLHPSLQEDLRKQGSNLKYYKSLSEFFSNHVNKIIFISKEWLIKNLDWEKLNLDAKGAVEGIHCTFFYNCYYGNKYDEYDVEYWDVLFAKFERDIPYFFVIESANSDSHKVEIHLEGISKIRFVNSIHEFIDKDIEFNTVVYIVIKEENIISYGGYFEEESGLCLPD